METITVRVKHNNVLVSWGMFISVGAAILYMKERNYQHFEVLQGCKVVYAQ